MNTPMKPILNNVKNRFLPLPEAVAKCWEPEPKWSDFTLIKEVGSGSFGHVYLVVHNLTKCQYAIKTIDKRNKTNIEEKPYFRREIEIMYKIHHPGVVRLFSHFEDDNYCYFIMEYIRNGNIYNILPKDKTRRLSTQIIASIIKDIISAVYFLHQMKPPIVHRDIKPENVWLTEGHSAKLTDFGWSNYISEEETRTTICGTPIYWAPEIINQKGHDEHVDIWCIGVWLFELATGSVPFWGNDIETWRNNIKNMKIAWPRDMSTDTKNLIMKILKYEPNARISLEDILKHPFFTKYFPNATQCLMKPNPSIQYMPFVVSKDNPEKDLMIYDNHPVHNSKRNNDINENTNPKKVITRRNQRALTTRDKSPLPISKWHLDKLNLTHLNALVKNENIFGHYNHKNKDKDKDNDNKVNRDYDSWWNENKKLKAMWREKDEKITNLIKISNKNTTNSSWNEEEYLSKINELQNQLNKYEQWSNDHTNDNKSTRQENYLELIAEERKKTNAINSKYEHLLIWSNNEINFLKGKIKELESQITGESPP